jgi:hypothetical protein
MKHLDQEQLVAHYYGDAGKDVAGHLAECYECRSEFAEIQRTLASIVPAQVPNRGAEYGAEVWDRVRGRLPEAAQPAWWHMPRRWAAVAAVATLVVFAFLIGQHTATAPQTANSPSRQLVRERVLMVALGDHLERSQVVLLDVTHASDAADVSLVRDEAEDLVGSNRLYRQAALKNGDRRTADVLDQLERALLEIAHSGPDESKAQIDQLRRQIESQGLLFKVQVIHSNAQREILPAAKKQAAPANMRPIA